MLKKTIISIGSIILACLVVSPIIQESVHLLILRVFSLYYTINFSAGYSISALVKVLSPADLFVYVLLLIGGIGASLIMGYLLILFGKRKEHYPFSMLGIGFLLNPSLAVFVKNDLLTLLSFVGLGSLSFIIGFSILGVCLYEFNRALGLMIEHHSN